MSTPSLSLYAGEYVDSPRKSILDVPVVGGFTTGRLKSGLSLSSNGSTAGFDQLMLTTFENVGTTPFTVQLVQTNDHVSGTRTNLGSAVPLVAGGRTTRSLTPTQQYLEVQGVGVGVNGVLKLTIDSRIRWNQLAFDKAEAIYPQVITEPAGLQAPDAQDPYSYPSS